MRRKCFITPAITNAHRHQINYQPFEAVVINDYEFTQVFHLWRPHRGDITKAIKQSADARFNDECQLKTQYTDSNIVAIVHHGKNLAVQSEKSTCKTNLKSNQAARVEM